jgi:threonine/homoserine/homoserine lactone efflux protein
MPERAQLLSIVALYAANVLVPGASFVMSVRTALASGRRAGFAVAFGLAAADIAYAASAVLGASAILQANLGLKAAVSCLGGAWLAWLGLRVGLVGRGSPGAGPAGSLAAVAAPAALRLGLTTGLSNPQSILFFGTVIAGNAAGRIGPLPGWWLVAAVAVVSVLLRNAIVAFFTSAPIRDAYLRRRRVVETMSGTALLAFGLNMAWKSAAPMLLAFGG